MAFDEDVLLSDEILTDDSLEEEKRNELTLIDELDSHPVADIDESPTGKLKRDLEREAMHRLEKAARTVDDFHTVVDWWNRLDANRERRERYHEIGRSSIPLDWNAAEDGMMFPSYMNQLIYRQVTKGDFLSAIFDCPFEIHELVTNTYISKLLKQMSDDQKEIFFFCIVHQYTTLRMAQMRGQSDRNIRKMRANAIRKLREKLYARISAMSSRGESLTLNERNFLSEYEKAASAMNRSGDDEG